MITASAPNCSASFSLPGVLEKRVTFAPNAFASLMAMWPNPPKPTTAILLPFPTFQWRSGDQVVIPAQSKGAVAAKSRLEGTFSTKCSSTTIFSEYPPKVCVPKYFSFPLYVPVDPFKQYCSRSCLQLSHVLQESTKQPTPA